MQAHECKNVMSEDLEFPRKGIEDVQMEIAYKYMFHTNNTLTSLLYRFSNNVNVLTIDI